MDLERQIDAVCEMLAYGLRTADIAAPGCRGVGTQALADAIAAEVERILATVET